MASHEGLKLVELDEDGVDQNFREDVLAGLSQEQKAIPARWFYDEAGSRLFEQITQLPEYYPTRAETAISAGQRGRVCRTYRARARRGGVWLRIIGKNAAVAERD